MLGHTGIKNQVIILCAAFLVGSLSGAAYSSGLCTKSQTSDLRLCCLPCGKPLAFRERDQAKVRLCGKAEGGEAAKLSVRLFVQSHSSAYVVAQKSLDAHRHLKLGDVRRVVLPDVEIAEVTLDKSVAKRNLRRSRDQRYEAFTTYTPNESLSFRIYFVERVTGRVYEVRGLPLPYRPFSALSWVNNRTLAFDRWSQPHYGVHYVVDVRNKRLVTAAAFPDEFYLEQQRPKPEEGELVR